MSYITGTYDDVKPIEDWSAQELNELEELMNS